MPQGLLDAMNEYSDARGVSLASAVIAALHQFLAREQPNAMVPAPNGDSLLPPSELAEAISGADAVLRGIATLARLAKKQP